MFSFMFGVLFSITFWAIYLPASFIITIVLIKAIKPTLLNPITKGLDFNGRPLLVADWFILLGGIIFSMIFWPFIIFAVIMWKLLVSTISKAILALMRKAIDSIPTISITFGDKEDKDGEDNKIKAKDDKDKEL